MAWHGLVVVVLALETPHCTSVAPPEHGAGVHAANFLAVPSREGKERERAEKKMDMSSSGSKQQAGPLPSFKFPSTSWGEIPNQAAMGMVVMLLALQAPMGTCTSGELFQVPVPPRRFLPLFLRACYRQGLRWWRCLCVGEWIWAAWAWAWELGECRAGV